MGKAQKKTGKDRLDKYYKLAKEQGYRARSAFKLIQLNKKYSFLENARCCIDLCAAPGGWLQIATKYMLANSVIVGVDLVPIKPIPHVSTFVADITTLKCRNLIRGELKDWKADVVLHDGAPNVGTAWVQDAYGQSELVLTSLKLAVEFLAKGGTFVTKVFRSTDYNNLIWVFNQLFDKVEATKPPASRNVSAEIFVVCRGFLAPKHIDPKFLDPRHVFKDPTIQNSGIDKASANDVQANVFQPEKKRRKRDGYDDGDYTLFKAASATEFVEGKDAVGTLGMVNKITFQNEQEKAWLSLDATTPEIKALCEDLKVLGKRDFKALLKWRTAVREEMGIDVKTKVVDEVTETVDIVERVEEQPDIDNELQHFHTEAVARAKRERRRANERKSRMIQRMQLQMTAPMDIGLDVEDKGLHMGQDDTYDLATEESLKKASKSSDIRLPIDGGEESDVGGNKEQDSASEDEQAELKVSKLEQELDGLYDAYKERRTERDAKFKIKEARKKNKERDGDWTGFGAAKSDEESEEDGSEEGGWEKTAEAKEKAGEESSADDYSDGEALSSVAGTKRQRQDAAEPSVRKRVKLVTELDVPEAASNAEASKVARAWFAQDMFKGLGDIENTSDGDKLGSDDLSMASEKGEGEDMEIEQQAAASGMDNDAFEVVPQEADNDEKVWDVTNEDEDKRKQATISKYGLVTPEAVTLAQQLVNRQKTKTQLINEGFNRYSFNSREDLPSWFLDDESKHYKPNIPVTKEAISILRAKQRALDARPIKKVAEAKARKKHRMVQRLEKAVKKAEGVNETTDLSEREKANQIEKLMRKGKSNTKSKPARSQVKVVVAKGAQKGIKGRPKGVKGRYTMVDARMKKEVRAQRRKEKAKKKRKRS